MRTLYTILIGIALVTLIHFLGRFIRNMTIQRGLLACFVCSWCLAMVWNMLNGIQQGYGFFEELPYFLLNFGIPTLLARHYLLHSPMYKKD